MVNILKSICSARTAWAHRGQPGLVNAASFCCRHLRAVLQDQQAAIDAFGGQVVDGLDLD
jgi:hypothetical protein